MSDRSAAARRDHGKGYPSPAFDDGLAPVSVIGLYLTALALLGLGIGAVLRSTAGAITCVLSLLLLPLIAAPLLPEAPASSCWTSRR